MKDALRRKIRQSGAYAAVRRAKIEARLLTAPDRSLPDFLVIGTHKGGTSSFYRNLCTHPQVFPAMVKEVHHFDQDPTRPARWYRAHFPSRAEIAAVGGVTGEASPSYSVLPQVPEKAFALVPNARIIMMLRDPVSRAYSNYQFDQRRGGVEMTFEQWVDRNMAQLGDRHLDAAAFHDLLDTDMRRATIPMGIIRGVYITQIRNWHAVYPKDQVTILDSADYFSDPGAFLNDVLADVFGLPAFDFAYQKTHHEGRGYDKIRPETADRLRAFYKPYNEELYSYLGRDFGW